VSTGARRARLDIARVIVLGASTAVVAQAVDVPAPVALGLWTAWWRLLPVLGVVVGYAPIVLLLSTGHSAVVVVAALLVLVAVEAVTAVVHGAARRTDLRPLPMGFLTAVAFAAGFEMAGATGSVVLVVLVHLVVGVLAETARGRADPDPSASEADVSGRRSGAAGG
jgi:predicted PurR-regulated permease PerM